MQPVALPPLREGQNAKVVLAENRGALRQANRRLVESRAWYTGVRGRYGATPLK